ncbi:hypothetical protein FNH05_04285 [Amycolatopsis rhizosphaerae]|uniref:Uncharacterized protein n=1 Tax=Amycolatopsis rhizosphaerae TaxID=2053003 RepID=A0A558DHR6_9PSEU|nr:hypothetical protein [Amycolatopsis rhizosphaerae]TVT60525.1 hypothetical protein FNH05_04285 [Amycolatopsis rhizosphaerae]
MKGKIARAVAVVVAGSVLAIGGAGVAAADSVGTSSTQAAGQQLLGMRDQLAKAAYAGDVQGTQRSLDQMSPLLGDLAGGQKYTLRSDAPQTAAAAKEQQAEASRVLADRDDPAEMAQVRQLPVPGLPDLPPPLNIVSNLIKSLLTLVTGLLAALLGGGVPALPLPLPVPHV